MLDNLKYNYNIKVKTNFCHKIMFSSNDDYIIFNDNDNLFVCNLDNGTFEKINIKNYSTFVINNEHIIIGEMNKLNKIGRAHV